MNLRLKIPQGTSENILATSILIKMCISILHNLWKIKLQNIRKLTKVEDRLHKLYNYNFIKPYKQ